MEVSGIIEPSTSDVWAAPIALATKKDGNIRLCIDFHHLNSITHADVYPMPRIDELLDRIGQVHYITALDLTRGYWQVPVAEDAWSKTAFTFPSGLYQFKVMPFGLSGATATFQRLMDKVLRVLSGSAAVYYYYYYDTPAKV